MIKQDGAEAERGKDRETMAKKKWRAWFLSMGEMNFFLPSMR
jgi:hypothetical protein